MHMLAGHVLRDANDGFWYVGVALPPWPLGCAFWQWSKGEKELRWSNPLAHRPVSWPAQAFAR